jgi:multiple sugar transport system ATP-binding protein
VLLGSVRVTHDQLEALSLADRIAVMNGGVIQQFGTPGRDLRRPGQPVRHRLRRRTQHQPVPRDGSPGQWAGDRAGGRWFAAAGGHHAGRGHGRGGRPATAGLRDHGTADIHGGVAVFEDFLEFGEAVVKVPGVEQTIVVQTPAEQRFRPGDDIAISAPAERIYLFDATTGDRLR